MSGVSEIKVPSLGESIREATVGKWLKSTGEPVVSGDVVVELETDKVTLEVTAPSTGVLSEVRAAQGSTVTVGDLLGVVAEGEELAKAKKVGGEVSAESSLETQKESGSLKLNFAAMTASAAAHSQQSAPDTKAQKASLLEGVAPSVRKIAEESAINPSDVSGTGKGGRVTKGDIINFSEEKRVPAPTTVTRTSDRREERVKMTRLRQRIAERLKEAQNTAAILTTFNEVDMSAVQAMRAKYKESFEKKHGVRLGIMSFFVKACIQALKELPAVNSEIDGDEIIYKNYYDIGVAVSTPQGLVVPVVRDADLLSFADVEKTIASLGQKARDGKLTIDEMTGGTFTVTNGGVFGSLMATPILNPPQTGILGMHKIQDRAVVVDGKIEIRPMMYVALSYDHRVIDGRESVTFLVRVKENLENPERLLLEM